MTPQVRDATGSIVGMQAKEENTVQAAVDESLKAVGATPEAPPASRRVLLPPVPSFCTEIITGTVAVVAILLLLFTGSTQNPPWVVVPPTAVPSPTHQPTTVPTSNPAEVSLSGVTVYGDYDEDTKIGSSPEKITCFLAGHSPDRDWVFLSCPAPIGHVWAKVADLTLSEVQQERVAKLPTIARVVPPTPVPAPRAVFTPPPQASFCADRSSMWGTSHQCASTQLEAEALAEKDIQRINATAEAIQKKH